MFYFPRYQNFPETFMNKWPQKLNGVVKPHLKNRDQVFDLSSLPIRELKTDNKYWGCWWLKSPQCLSGINSFVELCNLTSQVYREQITQHSPPLQKMGYADLLKAIFFCATNFRVDDKSQITFLIKIIKTHPGWYSSVDWVLAMSPRVASSISSQGTGLGWGPGPQWGPHERQPHVDVSLPLFLPPFSSL